MESEINSFNPNAKWKKLFSREYAVQYTEISLRSLSPEAKEVVPFTFYEQIYIPEENNEVCYVDENKWEKFLKTIQDAFVITNFKKFEHLFIKTGNQYVNFGKNAAKTNLSKKSNKELIKIYREYQKLCVRYAFFIWAAYFLNDFCAERARNVIQAKLKENEDPHPYFEAVFTPAKKAAIFKLTQIVSSTEKLSKKQSLSLYGKFKWIPCLDIQNRAWTLEEFVNHIQDFKKKKQIKVMPYKDVIKKLAVNREEKKILDLAKLFAYIKDLRDDFRRQGIYYIQNSLFQELSKRIGLNLHDLAYLREKEIIDCLQNDIKPDVNEINERKKGFVMIYNSDKELECVSGKKINETLIQLGLSATEDQFAELRGASASRGIARGQAVIVKGIKDLPNVNKGNILVAVTTHPDYMPAMQKAVAIVTDEGGVTSHAAIVARELGIPCVVGTKTATKSLNEGDYVKVDGTNGIIKILKKKD